MSVSLTPAFLSLLAALQRRNGGQDRNASDYSRQVASRYFRTMRPLETHQAMVAAADYAAFIAEETMCYVISLLNTPEVRPDSFSCLLLNVVRTRAALVRSTQDVEGLEEIKRLWRRNPALRTLDRLAFRA